MCYQYQNVSNYEKVRLQCSDQRLFEYAMIVTLQPGDVGLQPHVLFCFPPEVTFSRVSYQLQRSFNSVLYVTLYTVFVPVIFVYKCL